MTEGKVEYLETDELDQGYEIRDEAPHDFYATIPNIIDEMKLSPHAYRLYGCIKRTAGDSGKCWKSTRTLADACGMSMGKVSEAKQELENTYPPLIRITQEKDLPTHVIYVTDIWQINHRWFMGDKSVHIVNAKGEAVHNVNAERSHCETKNTTIKNNQSIKKMREQAKERTAKQRASKKDPLDFLQENTQASQELIAMRTRVETALHRNLDWDSVRSVWNGYEKSLIEREKETGETIERFMEWFNADEFRREKQVLYLNPTRIEDWWQKAFEQDDNDYYFFGQKAHAL